MEHKALILSAIIVLATPSLAAPAPTLADAGSGAAAASPAGKPADANVSAKPARSESTKYCFDVEGGTGSRINMRQCKTRADWAKEGVDVDNPNQ